MVWQSKQQHDIIGKALLPTLDCFESVVDSEANTAVVWALASIAAHGNHQIQGRSGVRVSMDGDKISGFHMLCAKFSSLRRNLDSVDGCDHKRLHVVMWWLWPRKDKPVQHLRRLHHQLDDQSSL